MIIDIHGYRKRYENALKLLGNDKFVSKANKKLILEFDKWSGSKPVKYPRRVKYLIDFRNLSRWFKKDLKKVTNKDIFNLFSKLEDGKIVTKHGKHFSAESIDDYKACLKTFYNSFLKNPEVMEGIKRKNSLKQLQPSDMWTEDELRVLVNAGQTNQQQGFLACLVETGARIGEIGSLKIKNIKDNGKDGIELFVTGKTGSRKHFLIVYSTYLRRWLEAHPLKNDKEAPLWITMRRGIWKKGLGLDENSTDPRAPSYSKLRKIVAQAAKNCGINKPCNPHIFRHSVTTILIRRGYHPSKLQKRMGWSVGSKMIARYQHLSPEDVHDEDRRVNGLADKKQIIPNMKMCPFCKLPNPTKIENCNNCGEVMDIVRREQLKKTQLKEAFTEILNEMPFNAGSIHAPQIQTQVGTGFLDAGSQIHVRKDGWVEKI